MGKIVVSENLTLDGVVQDPAGGEGFGRGGWHRRPAIRPSYVGAPRRALVAARWFSRTRLDTTE
jgi:hypothetical protein